MKKCPFCGADIEDNARFCLYCMKPLAEKEQILLHKKKMPQWIWILAAIVALFLTFAVIRFLKQPPQETKPPSDDPPLPATTASSQTEPADTQPVTEPSHTHNYSVENTSEKYQKQAATCTTPAVYYYSCLCGEKGSETFSHGALSEHNVVTDPGYPADCVKPGLTKGSHCSVCGMVFLAQTPIPVVSHTFDNDRDDSCNVCNYIRILNCNHEETVKLPAVAPTCIATGLTEGKTCALCKEILTVQTSLAPLGHKEVIDQAIVPTCTVDGKTEGKHCATCNVVLVAQVTLASKGHTEVIDPAIAATCTTGGKTEGKHCATCHVVLVVQNAVAAKGHTEVIDPAVAATCTTDGKTEGKHCSVCKLVLVYQQHLPALGHSFDPQNIFSPCSVCNAPSPHTHSYTEKNTAVEYQKDAATCLAPAVYYYSCLCGEKGSETFSSGKEGAHTVVIEEGYPATCDTPGLSDLKYCSVCQFVFYPHEETQELGHTFKPGPSLPTCLVCGDKGSVIIEAPDTLFFQNNTFRVDRITYVIRPSKFTEEWDITVSIKCTNLSSSTALILLDCSLYFYDEKGHWTGRAGGHYTSNVQPNTSGTCTVEFGIDDYVDACKLVIE